MTGREGILLVVSGPSGSGKGTVIGRLLERRNDFVYSVSATTRAPRAGERDGVNYYFISREEFEERISAGMMLEYAEYCGNYYGTPKKEVYDRLAEGKNVILEIEVNGAMQVREKCPDAVLLMIAPPDFATLEARLRGRGDDVPEEVLLRRLEAARYELSQLTIYDYIVINGNNQIDDAADRIIAVADAERSRVARSGDFCERFFSCEA